MDSNSTPRAKHSNPPSKGRTRTVYDRKRVRRRRRDRERKREKERARDREDRACHFVPFRSEGVAKMSHIRVTGGSGGCEMRDNMKLHSNPHHTHRAWDDARGRERERFKHTHTHTSSVSRRRSRNVRLNLLPVCASFHAVTCRLLD